MFRRYKSAGDEPGAREEIVIKVDPIAPKPAPGKSAGKPASKAGKSAPPAKSGKSAPPAKSGKAAPPAKSAASARSAVPVKSAKWARSAKSAPVAKSATSGKSAGTAKSNKSNKSARSTEKEAPAKRGFGWKIAGLLARPEPELDFEEDPEQDALDAKETARRKADLQAELERQAEEFGLVASDPVSLYGPNGLEVAALLDSLADVDDELAEEIADSYELTPEAERKVAQSVIRRRHRGGKLGMELDTAERAVSEWLSALALAEDEDIALYNVVADAAIDAVDALVLVDELADEDFNTLYTSWADVMDADEEDDEEAAEEEEADEAEARDQDGEETEEDEEAEPEGEFGPSTVLVTELLTKLGTLDSEPVVELIEVWREQPKEELRLAHHALQDLADESSKWREQMRLAQEEVFAWMEDGATRFNKIRGSAAEWARTREIAGPAVADAVAALVMADMLEAEDAAVLFDPWSKVIGEPALPVYEEDDLEDEDDGDEEDEDDGDEEDDED
jgi:hypothetical protein